MGAEATSLGGLVASYRTQRGSNTPVTWPVPKLMLNAVAWIGDRVPSLPVGSDTLETLAAGSSGNAEKFAQLRGRAPRSYREFLRGDN